MASKYQYPKLPAAWASYERYFEHEWRRRGLDNGYTYNVLKGRGNAWLWAEVGQGHSITAEQKKHFFEDAVYVQVKNKKTKDPVYGIYAEKSFWYVSSKERLDHDWLQSIANFHLDKLESAMVKTTTKE